METPSLAPGLQLLQAEGPPAPRVEKGFSEGSLLGNQGGSTQGQEENAPRVFPYTSDHGHLTSSQLRGPGRGVRHMQPGFHLPRAKALAAQESEFPGPRGPVGRRQARSCYHLQLLQLLFQKIQAAHCTF